MSETMKDGGMAFPVSNSMGDIYSGMSMRDYFAATALQGIVGNSDFLVEAQKHDWLEVPQAASKAAYEIADAMLAERARAVQS